LIQFARVAFERVRLPSFGPTATIVEEAAGSMMRIIFKVSSYLKTLVLGAYEAAERFHEAVAARAILEIVHAGACQGLVDLPLNLVLDLLVPRRGLHAVAIGQLCSEISCWREIPKHEMDRFVASTKRRFLRVMGGGVRMAVVAAPAGGEASGPSGIFAMRRRVGHRPVVGRRPWPLVTVARSSSSSFSEGSFESLREAREKLVEEHANDLLSKVAFLHQLTHDERENYVDNAICDLRTRLKGWPPTPAIESTSDRLQAISESMGDRSIVLRRTYPVGDSGESLLVLVEEVRSEAGEREATGSGYRVRFYTDSQVPVQLHWGVIGTNDETQSQWMLPPDELRPFDTSCNEEACNTDLGGGGALQMTMVEVSRNNPVAGLSFVLRRKLGGGSSAGSNNGSGSRDSEWLKAEDGGDFYVPLPTAWVESAASEKEAAARAGFLLEKIAQGTEGVVMYHHTYSIPGGTMIALVKAVSASYQVEIVVDVAEDRPISLHWGMATGKFTETSPRTDVLSSMDEVHADPMVNVSGEWVLPPEYTRPLNSLCEENSCSTELDAEGDHNVKRAIIRVKPVAGVTGISFVLKVGDDGYVKNERGEDFHIPVPAGILQELSHEATKSQEIVLQRVFALGRDGSHGRVLSLVSSQRGGEKMVEFFSDSPEPLVLHWGVSRAEAGEWTLPDISIMHEPSDSEIIAGKACETRFTMAPGQLLNDLLALEGVATDAVDEEEAGPPSFAYLQRACLRFKAESDAIALPFVVRTDIAGKQLWFKDYWGNYLLPLEDSDAAMAGNKGTPKGALKET